MTKRFEIYKCEICGNMIVVIQEGVGELVCCGQPMSLLKGSEIDAATEKHVPVIEKKDNGFLVKVGEVPHPMEEKHYIQWIELIVNDDTVFRKFLKPNDKPEAFFELDAEEAKTVTAREYCNLHGLWKK